MALKVVAVSSVKRAERTKKFRHIDIETSMSVVFDIFLLDDFGVECPKSVELPTWKPLPAVMATQPARRGHACDRDDGTQTYRSSNIPPRCQAVWSFVAFVALRRNLVQNAATVSALLFLFLFLLLPSLS